jgi:peptidyl-prolyl cis-trans isomerase B (cyclophilin B)
MIAIGVVAMLAGCGSSTSSSRSSTVTSSTTATPTGTSQATQSVTTTAAQPGHCLKVAASRPRPVPHLKPPAYTLSAAKTYTVNVTTTCGSFAFSLDVAQSPKTTASFYSLVKSGFYNGLMFQRVASNFVIQGGDPLENDTGGPGYTVVEPPPKSTQYVRGTVAMAEASNQPPGSSGSQFFIVTAANASQSAALTPTYAVVGKVVSGLDVVDAIGALPTNPPQDGAPTPPVVIKKMTVSTS